MEMLTIAIAKGRIEKDLLSILKEIGLGTSIDPKSRKLVFIDSDVQIKYIFVKPVDVVTYVEKGVADIGVVGKDVIVEQEGNIYELLDLNIAKCHFAVAGPPLTQFYNPNKRLRVATKYVNIANKFFEDRQQIETIFLNGSVELAPLIGLSDVIVDLVETGNTLRANGLEELEFILESSARVVSNRVSYQFKFDEINKFVEALREWRNNNDQNLTAK
ncbi:MAG: hisG [Bacillales bacterium]|jgi:ATP phosphoribosyltransferase|nr:hisG [Bacillales bacterium]